MIDPSNEGKEYPSYSVEVDQERIEEFATAIGDSSALFRQSDEATQSRFSGVVAPPTFPTIFREGEFQILLDLKIDMRKLLHAGQEYEYTRPLKPGETLTCTPRISEIKTKEGKSGIMDFMTSEVIVTDDQEQNVCVARSTIVVRR